MDPDRALSAIGRLLSTQSLAVLATLDGEEPYTNLIAIAPSVDLKRLLFCTSQFTRKHENLQKNRHVALLIDNRRGNPRDFGEATAVTVLGVARAVEEGGRKESEREFLQIHPYLVDFVHSPTTVLYEVRIRRYVLVRRFQNVSEVAMDE
ncbi:pyridoxamine 5'-phosphate oxidase family protein [Methanofollis tationis]|uniref:Pyridoxamine 5'-phosphate oxidase family protein n=1 Tax=Methanofollis tationis TaxID=81417 RepID=A0A7K4HQ89_9EURY|nr:pyridoxamine 5'-phosphate oxidase family protein [Methanofollis tationis]NVO67399.1 pyridoxamine 5'-phosphate oxidase family protein [Methanofollis tationis]